MVWQKTYGGTGDENSVSIQQTIDGGYIVGGYTNSFGSGNFNFWVIKLDNIGGVVWQKTYGGSGSDYARSIQQTSDGGYIVGGETTSYGAGATDLWVIKLDENGGVVWQKTFGGIAQDYSTSIQQTSDGGFIVTGETHSFGAGGQDIWVLKLDAEGSISGCPGEMIGVTSVTGVDTSATISLPSVTGQDALLTAIPSTATASDTSVTGGEVCTGVEPNISISPTSKDFGNVNVGTSSTQSFQFSNTGTADLIIGTITVTGTNASEFTRQNDLCIGQTLAPGGSCTLEMAFSPATMGSKTASLNIPSNDSDLPTATVPLSGTGADLVAPTVQITSPTSSPTYATNQPTLNMAGTASDNLGVTQLTWVSDRGGSGTATGATSWSVTGISLQPGTNVITVMAFDGAGNSGTDTLTATYETVSIPNTPGGPIHGVKGISYTYTVGGSATNPPGHNVQYWVDWGDGTSSGWLAIGTTSASKTWNAAGPYNVTAKARCATDTTSESVWSPALTVTMANGTLVSGAVSGTWTCANSPYIVTGSAWVSSGAVLEIQSCVVMKFTGTGDLTVYGTLTANGNPSQNIHFTSIDDNSVGGNTGSGSPAPGAWRGIRFQGDGSYQGSGTLTHSVFRYGGQHWSGDFYTTLFLYGTNSHVTLTDSTVEYSSHVGLYAKYTTSPIITRCSFLNNAEWGIAYRATSINLRDSSFGGNGSGAVRTASLSGETIGNITLSGNTILSNNGGKNGISVEGYVAGNCQWQANSGFPYIMTNYFLVNAGATLTLDPGAVIKFATTQTFTVQGTLNAPGTSGNEIHFTSIKDDTVGGDTNGDDIATFPARGDWAGVYFQGDYYNPVGTLAHCKFRYGGQLSTGPGDPQTTFWVYGTNASVSLTDSTVEYSSHVGLYAKYTTSPIITRCSFLNNAEWGIAYRATSINLRDSSFGGNGSGAVRTASLSGETIGNITLSGNTIFSNNGGKNGVSVEGYVAGNCQWQANSGFPYIMTNYFLVNAGATLTLDPGAVIKFATTQTFTVQGTLNAPGTSGNEIHFTSIKDDTVGGDTNGDDIATFPARGDWAGVYFQGDYYNPVGTLTHCVFKYGGQLFTGSPTNVYTTIWIYSNNAIVTLTDSTVENSSHTGIHLKYVPNAPPISRCSFSNNAEWGIVSHSGPVNISGSTFSGNGSGGIRLDGSTGQISTSTFSSQPKGIRCENNANPVIGGSVANHNTFSGNTLFGVENTTSSITVNATSNYWGNESGPQHSSNPGGIGDRVSNYVILTPWIGEDFSLTVTKSGTGDGTITSSPAGINCGSDCSESYDYGAEITLTAISDSASRFVDWTGCDSVTGNQCLANVTSPKTVTATFEEMIERTVWSDLEVIRRINNGVLESELRRYGSNGSSYLAFYNSGSVNSFSADVTIKGYANNGSYPHASLLGYAYNDGTQGEGHTGDVLGVVGIGHNGTQLEGFYSISKCTAANCNLPDEYNQICEGLVDPGFSPSVNTPYTTAFSWNGSSFTFTIGGHTKVVSSSNCTGLPPSGGAPRVPMKGIGTRISQIDGADEGGYISATFDNVYK